MTRLQDVERRIRNLEAERRRIIIAQMPAEAQARTAEAKARREPESHMAVTNAR